MTRLIILILAVTTSFAFAQSDQQLSDRYDRMYETGKYELALGAAEKILERYPESAWWRFNAGAVCAKLDRSEEAIVHLQQCADLKFSGVRSFEQNSDLDSLRAMEAFIKILEQVRSNAKTRMDEFQREAKVHQPLVSVPEMSEGEKLPLILAMHGTGMDGKSMHDALLESATQERMILISPDALRPAGEGFSWTYSDEAEWFVQHLIDLAVEKHNADPERVILLGFSQGANIALVLGQTQPEKFAGVIPICGHYEAQIAEADETPTAFYLMTGGRDPWRRTYMTAKKDMEAAGGAVQTRVLTARGHELPSGKSGTKEYVRALRWVLEQ